nr:hypothetical protein [Tanacetum cinerariifolium]
MENAMINNEDRMRRTILASDLALHTVENVAYINDMRNGRYTHSCKILEKACHFINGREVTVEQYRGLAGQQWLFLEGKFKVKLEGIPVDLHASKLYKILVGASVCWMRQVFCVGLISTLVENKL